MMRSSLSVVIVLGLAGCATADGSRASSPVSARAKSVPTAPTPAAPTARVASDEAAKTATAKPSAFRVWAEREGDLSLEGGEDTPWIRGGMGMSHLVGHRIEHEAAMLTGITSPYAEGGTFFGEYPKNAWLQVDNFVGRNDVERSLLHWEKDRWRAVRRNLEDVRGMALWRNGSVLALTGYPRAQLKVIAGPAAQPGVLSIDRSLCASSVAALESGEIVVVGNRCEGKDGESSEDWLAQRWSATGVKSKPEPLGNLGDSATIVLRSANEAYVHTVEFASITAWNGQAWSEMAIPDGTKVPSLQVSKQGTLWIAGTKLYRKAKGASWEEVALPRIEEDEDLNLQQVWAKDDADVWVVGSGPKTVVLRNQAVPDAVAMLPNAESLWRQHQDTLPITAATRTCNAGGGGTSGFFVSLGAVPANGVRPDLAPTMSAIKDDDAFENVRFVETLYRGERQIGAEVDDLEQGNKLTKLLKRTLPTVPARFVCHVFVVTRDLTADPIEDAANDQASGKSARAR